MTLTPCRECGQQVSNEAPSCPHCGVPDPAKAALEAREQAKRRLDEAMPGGGAFAAFIKEDLEAGRRDENIAKDLKRQGVADIEAYDMIRIVREDIHFVPTTATRRKSSSGSRRGAAGCAR